MVVDVLCLGEILVDWVSTTPGADLDLAEQFTKAAGGAPANTAVGLAKQGVSVGFVGRVSADAFGTWLKSILELNKIDTTGAVTDPHAQTRMAYIVTTKSGDRKLAEFTRVTCADALLEPTDLLNEQFEKASVLHIGSISLIQNPSMEATEKAVDLAHKNKMIVSYDPNVRLGLWQTPLQCKNKILGTLAWADVVKINEDELEFLTGSRDLTAADTLRSAHELPLLIVTLDHRGAFVCTEKGSRTVSGFKVALVEATGAGDGFNSGVISGLLPYLKKSADKRKALRDLSLNQLADIIRRANAIGAIACTKAGAIPALPTKAETDIFLKSSAQASS